VTLQYRIAGRPLPKQEVVELAMQISDALDAAHSKGIIHRDIKPANLFITVRGQAKVLDFGLAKLMSQEARETAAEDGPMIDATIEDNLTVTGTTVGTVAYMSPSRCAEKSWTHAPTCSHLAQCCMRWPRAGRLRRARARR